VGGVREVHDLDPDGSQPLLEPAPLRGVTPVVALEDPVEADGPPGVQLVGAGLGVHRVDEADAGDDLETLGQRHERPDPLDRLARLVRHDPRDQHVAVVAGLAQGVEVADVEEVVDARDVTDGHAHEPSVFPCFSIV